MSVTVNNKTELLFPDLYKPTIPKAFDFSLSNRLDIIADFYQEIIEYMVKKTLEETRGDYYQQFYKKLWTLKWCPKFASITSSASSITTIRIYGIKINRKTLDIYNIHSTAAFLGNILLDTVDDIFIEHRPLFRYERWHPRTGELKPGHKHSREF